MLTTQRPKIPLGPANIFTATVDRLLFPLAKKLSLTIKTIDNAITQLLNDFFLEISNVNGANITKTKLNIVINDNKPELSFENKYTAQEGEIKKVY